ncbi:hypothetical protein [Helicobacter bilis]|uniref:hypothetical protein n=1 Tax=Helicobacter bilis TaxID=37372 RepID=UPI00248F262A|nr:hypothetical protein [Helicobacter bilis]
MLLKSVLMGFLSFHSVDTTMLKECENHADKISGCVEREYFSNRNLWIETPYKNEKIISGKCGDGKAFSNAYLHNLEKRL